MLIYGTKPVLIASQVVNETCTHCGSRNTIKLFAFQKYAHLFWIPFFPIEKTGVSECSHCKQVLKLNEMPMQLKNIYYDLTKQAKPRIWMYSGFAVVAVIITISIISARQNEIENKKFIADPRRGDIYEIRLSYNSFILYKVNEVKGDTVYLQQSLFETNKKSALSEIEEKGFTDESTPFHKTEITEMFESDKLIDVNRREK